MWPSWGLNLQSLDLQSDVLQTELWNLAFLTVQFDLDLYAISKSEDSANKILD